MTGPRPRRLPLVRVLPTADDVAEAAAAGIVVALAAAIAERGVAHWSTTGGSAAPGIYRHLRIPPLRDLVDWSRVHVWWGDDRFVPADDPLSNVLPLTELLLAAEGDDGDHGGVRIPVTSLHPVPVAEAIVNGDGPVGAAAAYETSLLLEGPGRDQEGVPAFDVLVLGVGPDGHVLSVFPGSAVWDEGSLVRAVPAPTHVEPHVERVTMHPDVVAAARSVLVVSTGASKAAVLGLAWGGDDARELPVRMTMATNATWILDEAAAAELPRE
ncbi:MAG: 6-phosphogluconolactonase [Chloroflexi bacterium]|nr:6-phosphogluconolactonase [Chloroflexota bacterium]